MSFTVAEYLADHGPSRSGRIADALVASGVSPEAARQRVARVKPPLRKFPVPLLPKRECFLYLQKDRNDDHFWRNFVRDLRETNSVFGVAIDGMIARGGIIRVDQFATISAAPVLPQKGQLTAEVVAKRLIAANFLTEVQDADFGPCYQLPMSLASGGIWTLRAYGLAERIILDGVREWARKIGLASFNTIRIRGEAELRPIGPFAFDLAGPSYLLPLQGGASKPGFLVVDAFAEGRLNKDQVQYFIRKARMLKANLDQVRVLSILVAESFTGEALKAGHAAGVMMATPKDLFGNRVGVAISSLVEVLKNSAAYAAASPQRLTQLLDNLFEIEGRAGNLRGILFELVAAYLARRDAVSIDMNVIARDLESGERAEIDVQKVTNQASSVTAIECKGKIPGGTLTLTEVEEWLRKIRIIRAHYRGHRELHEAEHRFELWTSGTIDHDALQLLTQEKAKRTKSPIDWKDGAAVLALARAGREKGIADALHQHFLKHPLADVSIPIDMTEASAPPPPPVTFVGGIKVPKQPSTAGAQATGKNFSTDG